MFAHGNEHRMLFNQHHCDPFTHSGNNQWYQSVGVFNTGGILVKAVTLNGFAGTPNGGSSGYFDFYGSGFSGA